MTLAVLWLIANIAPAICQDLLQPSIGATAEANSDRIEALVSAGRPVELPIGILNVDPLELPRAKTIVISGEGPNISVLNFTVTDESKPAIEFVAKRRTLTHAIFERFSIFTSGSGIVFESEEKPDKGTVRWSRFSDIEIFGRNHGIGIDVVAADGCEFKNVTVRDFETCWRFRRSGIRTVVCEMVRCRAINPLEYGFHIQPGCRGLLFRQCRAENNEWKLNKDQRGKIGWLVEGKRLPIGEGHRFEMCETEDAWFDADVVVRNVSQMRWVGGGPGTNLLKGGPGTFRVERSEGVWRSFDREVDVQENVKTDAEVSGITEVSK